ncbi:MAG: hypothetical protein ACT4O0_16915 [Pseudonocardia sp.]|jgi:hypothetical protein
MEHIELGDPRARAFTDALHRFERDPESPDLIELFAEGARLRRLDARGERGDPAGFWREYRNQFREIETTFHDVVEGKDRVALPRRERRG